MRDLQAIKAEWKNDPPRPACEVINYLCDLAAGLAQERDSLKLELADCAENHYSAKEGRTLETERDSLRAQLAKAQGVMFKTLTPEQIDSCLKLGRAEVAANEEYATNRYSPEKGGPAMERLRQVRAEHGKMFPDPVAEWRARAERAETQLATARALAFEEAALWHDKEARNLRKMEQQGPKAREHEVSADVLRRFAPLPPTLVAVPVETLAKVREAMELYRRTNLVPDAGLNGALALLDSVAK